jgi:calcium permeable stress-gated cation channel
MQLFGLIWNLIRKYILGREENPTAVPSFPYHTEIPKLLLFGLLGFTCSILAPLILPFLLIYYFLGYIVYRNQVKKKKPDIVEFLNFFLLLRKYGTA